MITYLSEKGFEILERKKKELIFVFNFEIGQEIIQSLVDMGGYAVFLRIAPFDLTKNVGVPPTYVK